MTGPDRILIDRHGGNWSPVDGGTQDVEYIRHTAAVHMVAAGVPMAQVSQYLGHSSIAVTERVYARFAPDHLRAAADVLDFTKLRKVQ